MSLSLKVISYRGLPQSQELKVVFDQAGGVIGRSHECTFVLPDPDKFISRKHAFIEYVGGSYRLTDTSTAGTEVTSRSLLLQHDSLPLMDGDRLKIGDYELSVSLDQEESSFVPTFPQTPESCPAPLASEPFPFIGSEDLPLPETTLGAAATFIDQPDVPIFQAHFAPPEPESALSLPGLPDFNLEDLFADLESPPPAVASIRPAITAEDEGWEIPDDLFKGLEEFAERPEEVLAVPPPLEPASAQESTEQKLREMSFSAPVETVEGPVSASVQGLPTSEPVAGAVIQSGTASLPSGTVATLVPQPRPDAGRQMELLRAFLEGAGLANSQFLFSEADLPRLMRTAGVLLRNMTDGLMIVLRARAELKSQFRVSMTTMRQMNNNPLKFTVNVDEAMKILLAKEHSGFTEASAAVQEGFGDLMNHQMALTAATQASVAEILKRFDPHRFEKAYEEGIVFQKKAKCWDAYCKAYAHLVEEAMENFFGDEFAEAYERQLRSLRSGGNKG